MNTFGALKKNLFRKLFILSDRQQGNLTIFYGIKGSLAHKQHRFIKKDSKN